ncbi:hypothetical protein PoB_004876600 [Plakobranchus ocellatus]|uniref:FLYWCH-type domain-containing protein n=1 Tax=Plakobranchus ocellatus TaxID=259542 RepID=A0AAV4BT71_9GAST|nr:hypothetical protein PoB_004876600 [Plakobranchus ocellatus]
MQGYEQFLVKVIISNCSHDPSKKGENDGSSGASSITAKKAQKTKRFEQRTIDYPCIWRGRLSTEKGITIYRTKMKCLDNSMDQQRRSAQADKTSFHFATQLVQQPRAGTFTALKGEFEAHLCKTYSDPE